MPTSMELCETYSKHYPEKIQNLRPDSFALLMNMANVHSNSRVVIAGNTKGFLSGALIERQVKAILRVELNEEDNVRVENEILLQYDFHCYRTKMVSYLSGQ